MQHPELLTKEELRQRMKLPSTHIAKAYSEPAQ